MATLAVIDAADRVTGVDNTATLAAATSGGDEIPAGTDVYLRVKCGSTACTVTVMAAGANAGPNGTFLAPLVLGTVPVNGDRTFGPFPGGTYADPSDGLVHLTYSQVTSVTVGVFRYPNA